MTDPPQSPNPYHPPEAQPPSPDAATLRGRLLHKEAMIRVLGAFYLGMSLAFLGMTALFLRPPGLPLPFILLFCFLAGLLLHAGYRLVTLNPGSWRYVTIFTGALTLLYVGHALTELPKLLEGISWDEWRRLGPFAYVALLVPAFYVLVTRDGRFLLSTEYRDLIAATPGLKFWRTWTAIFGFLLILYIASTVVQRIEQ